MKSCGMSFIKYILFIFNFIFAISGLGILIAGALVLADVNEFNHFLENTQITAPPIVLIVTGSIIFLVASLGCYGAIKESPNLLYLYAILLAIIFVVELAVGIAACVYKSDMESLLKESLEKSIVRASHDDLVAWDHAQSKLKCCGVTGYSDWRDYNRNGTVRGSCCLPELMDETKNCRNAIPAYVDRFYKDGCLMKLKEHIGNNATVIIGVGIGLAFLQLLGILLACWLASAIRNERAK